MHQRYRRPPVLQCALLSLLYLGGSLALAFPASSLASDLASSWHLRLSPALFAGALLLCCATGGALWGRHLARAFGYDARAGRMSGYGALGFGLAAPMTLFALGIGARLGADALATALRCAATAAFTFLAVAALMDAAGRRVGAPGAEARFTMVVVLGVGLIAATVAGGGVLGRLLARMPRHASESSQAA